MRQNQSIIQQIANWLEDWGADAGLGFFTIIITPIAVLAFTSDFTNWYTSEKTEQEFIRTIAFYVIIISMIAQIVFYYKTLLSKKGVSKLKMQIQILDEEVNFLRESIRYLLEGYLSNLARNKLQFGSRTVNSERITLYVDNAGKCFIPVGRYSSNPELNITGRPSYPINEGYISQAWQHGNCFVDDLPDYNNNPTEYIKMLKLTGIPKKTIQKLTMRSRLYYGCRILDKEQKYPIAVLMVESSEADRFTKTELEAAIANADLLYLTNLITIVKPYIGQPSAAKKAGF